MVAKTRGQPFGAKLRKRSFYWLCQLQRRKSMRNTGCLKVLRTSAGSPCSWSQLLLPTFSVEKVGRGCCADSAGDPRGASNQRCAIKCFFTHTPSQMEETCERGNRGCTTPRKHLGHSSLLLRNRLLSLLGHSLSIRHSFNAETALHFHSRGVDFGRDPQISQHVWG